MKALVYHGPHQMRWEDWPEPEAGPSEAIVAVRAVGICGSDLHGFTGESGRRRPPMVMGHEATGEVLSVEPGVPADLRGMRVVVQPIVFCGVCDQCRAGHVYRCRSRRFLGGNMSGAMAERVAIPVTNLLPLPNNVSFVHGTLTEPLAVALHAVQVAGDMSGRSVLIAGSGPIGLFTLVAARHAGARVVMTTDILPKRRATAMLLGADAVLDPAREDWQQELARVVQAEEVDVSFDAVGIPATLGQALSAVRPGGRVVAIGGWRTVPVDLNWVVTRELHVQGTFNFTPTEFDEARLWLKQGRIAAHHIVTDVRPLADGAAVFANLAAHSADSIKVVLSQEVG